MGNSCTRKTETLNVIDTEQDIMFKEFIDGKHDMVDSMKIKGDSFMIPKVKKIERVDNGITKEKLLELDSLVSEPYVVSSYTPSTPENTEETPPSLGCDPPLTPKSFLHSCTDSAAKSCHSDEIEHDVFPIEFHDRPQQTVHDAYDNKFSSNESINEVYFSNSTNSNSSSTPPSRVGRRTRWKRNPSANSLSTVASFDNKNWIWMTFDNSNVGRAIPITPMASDQNIPPPYFTKLIVQD